MPMSRITPKSALTVQPADNSQREAIDDRTGNKTDASADWRLEDLETRAPADQAERLNRAEALLVGWMLQLWDQEHRNTGC